MTQQRVTTRQSVVPIVNDKRKDGSDGLTFKVSPELRPRKRLGRLNQDMEQRIVVCCNVPVNRTGRMNHKHALLQIKPFILDNLLNLPRPNVNELPSIFMAVNGIAR